MEQNFAASLKELLKSEGGNDDDPLDHGGRTSRGITQSEYNHWRKMNGKPTKDVWTASDAEVKQIYYDDYWLPHGPDFPKGLDYLFFDMAVNAGPSRAMKLLQRTLGTKEDGIWGPNTNRALLAANPKQLVKDYTVVKKAWYKSLKQKRFINGWINRANDVQAAALKMLA